MVSHVRHMILCVLLGFDFTIFAKGFDSPVLCPGSDKYEFDTAHLMFDLPKELNYADLVEIANDLMHETDNPDLRDIEVRQSIDYSYKDLPVFTHYTGRYRTYQFPEEEVEYIVIRPLSDCYINADIPHSKHTHIYSRAFERDEINIALVKELILKDVLVFPLSERGLKWICATKLPHDHCTEVNADT